HDEPAAARDPNDPVPHQLQAAWCGPLLRAALKYPTSPGPDCREVRGRYAFAPLARRGTARAFHRRANDRAASPTQPVTVDKLRKTNRSDKSKVSETDPGQRRFHSKHHRCFGR